MERRIDQANRHRQAIHNPEQPVEVGPLERQKTRQRFGPFGIAARQDHRLDVGQPLGFKEHMLGTTQSNALGAVFAGFGITRIVGVGPHPEATEPIGQPEEAQKMRISNVG